MNATSLHLPNRGAKPRRRGLTAVIDGGLPLGTLAELLESAGEYVDLLKFGWGTAVVSPQLGAKVSLLRRHGIDFYLGGTLFEKHVLQGRFDEFRTLCQGTRMPLRGGLQRDHRPVEHREGGLRPQACRRVHGGLRGRLQGQQRSERLSPRRWIECIEEDLDAGAALVTLEATRER